MAVDNDDGDSKSFFTLDPLEAVPLPEEKFCVESLLETEAKV